MSDVPTVTDGKPLHVFDENAGVSKRWAMAETDQFRFELDQTPGGAAVLRGSSVKNRSGCRSMTQAG